METFVLGTKKPTVSISQLSYYRRMSKLPPNLGFQCVISEDLQTTNEGFSRFSHKDSNNEQS